MPISTDMIVRVAHADVAMELAFSSSVWHWHRKVDDDCRSDVATETAFPNSVRHWHRETDEYYHWMTLAGECDAVLIGPHDAVVIEGNCTNGVSAPFGGIIHIYGNLVSRISVSGHYEIVITGDVGHDAVIDASGFCDLFVGGKFSGKLHSSSSTKIWIESDFNGLIKTGAPRTTIYVGDNYEGSVSPQADAALLDLTVAGFAANASLSKIMDCGYTQFRASIARSDVAPGLYPLSGYHRKKERGNSFNQWCVHQRSEERQPRASLSPVEPETDGGVVA